ncbi:MAG: response regulator, partial [Sphingomonas sp.]
MSTVLVVDDDAAIRTVVGQALRRAGHDVTVADSLAQLERALATVLPDV